MEPTPRARHHHPLRARLPDPRPGALWVRLPATASDLSPSAAAVRMSGRDLRRLVAIAVGR